MRLPVDERRSRLLQLGLELFSERSYDDVTTDDIALAAGVSKGLLYHYFANKRGYYVATIRELGRRLMAATALDPHVHFAEAIRGALFRFIDFVRHNGAFYRALMRGGIGQDDEVQRIIEDVRQTVIGRVLERAGVGQPPPHQRTAIYGWVGFSEAVSLDWLDHGCDLSDEAVVDMMLQSLVGMISSTADPHATRH
jgi:AcrR family transcriptional regulator